MGVVELHQQKIVSRNYYFVSEVISVQKGRFIIFEVVDGFITAWLVISQFTIMILPYYRGRWSVGPNFEAFLGKRTV